MVDESGAGAEPKYVFVPPGFPRTLTDKQLEEAVATYAEGLRRTADAVASGMTNQAVVLVHGTLLDVGSSELFRRHLRRSERIARLALIVAIIATTSARPSATSTSPACFSATKPKPPKRACSAGRAVWVARMGSTASAL